MLSIHCVEMSRLTSSIVFLTLYFNSLTRAFFAVLRMHSVSFEKWMRTYSTAFECLNTLWHFADGSFLIMVASSNGFDMSREDTFAPRQLYHV